MPGVRDYAPGCKRTYVIEHDKSWVGNEIDAHVLITKIETDGQLGVIVARQLELCYAFGLRVEESWLARPVELLNQALDREVLRIEHGTKGGRSRLVPVSELLQIDVLLRAASHARSDRSSMIPASHTLKQWDSTFYRIVRKHGLTRKSTEGGLGVTVHGLRHQYVHDLYRWLTGHEPPVRGGYDVDREIYQASLKTLIEAVGHSDIRKAGAYLSTPRVMSRVVKLRDALSCENAALDSVAASENFAPAIDADEFVGTAGSEA